jgi:hypothetical protein
MILRLAFVISAVVLCSGSAQAISKGRQCLQACPGLIAFCTSVGQARGFGDLSKGCKKSVLKRCKQEGVGACQAFCGDGTANGTEACDGSDFAGATCATLGKAGGSLACAADCTIDSRGCTSTCGDGTKDPGEDCDQADLGGTTCQNKGFTGGTAVCTPACRIDLSDCSTTISVELPVSLPAGNVVWEEFTANSGGFFVGDAQLAIPSRFDAYDGLWKVSVNGTFYNPGSTADLTVTSRGRELAGSPVTLSGVEVSQVFTSFDAADVLRTVVTFHNPTGADVPLAITAGGNFGSDFDTMIEGTSSGDASFDQADRWLVTSDVGMPPLDPVNVLVFFGPGTVSAPVTASLVIDEVVANFALTVPAGATRRLLFFSALASDPTGGLAAAATFDTKASVEAAGLLQGLTAAVRAEIVNWGL